MSMLEITAIRWRPIGRATLTSSLQPRAPKGLSDETRGVQKTPIGHSHLRRSSSKLGNCPRVLDVFRRRRWRRCLHSKQTLPLRQTHSYDIYNHDAQRDECVTEKLHHAFYSPMASTVWKTWLPSGAENHRGRQRSSAIGPDAPQGSRLMHRKNRKVFLSSRANNLVSCATDSLPVTQNWALVSLFRAPGGMFSGQTRKRISESARPTMAGL
jgi:hypothetical protein